MIARFSAGKVKEFISETNYFHFLKQQKLSGQQIFVVRAICALHSDMLGIWIRYNFRKFAGI